MLKAQAQSAAETALRYRQRLLQEVAWAGVADAGGSPADKLTSAVCCAR